MTVDVYAINGKNFGKKKIKLYICRNFKIK